MSRREARKQPSWNTTGQAMNGRLIFINILKNWDTEYSAPGQLESIPDLDDTILENMNGHELYLLAEKANGILPVCLYDHSIQSVSTRSFMGWAQHADWDSGQIGWIYTTHEQVKNEYGEVTPETIQKAESLLVGEVEEYDYRQSLYESEDDLSGSQIR